MTEEGNVKIEELDSCHSSYADDNGRKKRRKIIAMLTRMVF